MRPRLLTNIISLTGALILNLCSINVSAQNAVEQAELEKAQQLSRRSTSTMDNPFELVEDWPTLLSGQEWGAAIGLLPDDTGGLWMLFRSEPPINYINADGQIT